VNRPLPFRHVVTLSVLAVAQPLFDILSRHSQFFVTSNSSSAQILGMVLLVMLVPALALLVLQRALRPLSSKGGDYLVLLLLMGLLAARLANQLGVDSNWVFALLVVTLAGSASLSYWRWQAARNFVDFLVIAVPVVPAVFLYQLLYAGPLGELHRNLNNPGLEVSNPAPIVFIIIDEVPTTSLQQLDGTIDAARFPNFARLAGTASWYRNATTVADSTEVAIPALLTGLRPDPGWTNPTASATRHPRNLFTALAGHYQVNAFEPITALCPPSVCPSSARMGDTPWRRLLGDISVVYTHLIVPPGLRSQLPSIDQYWSGFFNKGHDSHLKAAAKSPRAQFLESLSPLRPNSFNFVHIYLPHVPWRYLPSGHVYASHPRDYRVEGFDPAATVNIWLDDPTAIALAYQRHLLQLAYVDNWLGGLLDQLEAEALWQQTLFVLVADHGLSFKPGEPRRWVSEGNLDDIAPVPLFVKYPGQGQGVVEDRSVETVDIVPTLFRELGIESSWKFDGIALQDIASLPQRSNKQLLVKQRQQGGDSFVQRSLATDFQQQSATPRFRQATLGEAAATRGLFDISPSRSLLGSRVSELEVSAGTVAVSIHKPQVIRRFRRDKNRLLPAYLRGQLNVDPGDSIDIAVALNGVIRGVTRTFIAGPPGRFALVLPEEYFLEADNSVEVFQLLTETPPRLQSMIPVDKVE
jgi:hypothetical protein